MASPSFFLWGLWRSDGVSELSRVAWFVSCPQAPQLVGHLRLRVPVISLLGEFGEPSSGVPMQGPGAGGREELSPCLTLCRCPCQSRPGRSVDAPAGRCGPGPA